MLQAFASGNVGKRQEEVVHVVVVRGVLHTCFAHQVAHVGQKSRPEVRVLRLIAHHIQVVLRRNFRRQRELVEVLPGEDGRILKLLHVGSGELRRGSRRRNGPRSSAHRLERRPHTPAIRHLQRRLNGNVADRDVGRVEQELLPLQHRHLVAHPRRDDAIQVRVQPGRAGRNGQVELVHIHVVPAPFLGLAVDGEHHPGNVAHRSRGPMIAGDPLRGDQGQRPRRDRKLHFRVVQFARSVGQVGDDLDGCLLSVGRAGEQGGKQAYSESGKGEATRVHANSLTQRAARNDRNERSPVRLAVSPAFPSILTNSL